MAPTSVREVSWLLDGLVERVSDIKQAVILSRDGLTAGASRGISREDAEHLSALAAGLQSLARGAGERFNGGEVRQSVIEMEHAFLFVMAAGQGSCLAVLTGTDVNVGLVAYEVAMLVKRVGPHFEAAPRFTAEDLGTEYGASGGT
jgi:predicted regulator of Ras-like GTPase activity (Roadblock/LC7/MglB family)